MDEKKFDLDPQEVLMRAYLELEKGWVQGRMRSAQGVCMLGALDVAITGMVREKIEAVPCPEGVSPELFRRAQMHAVLEVSIPIRSLFEQALRRNIPGDRAVPSWNDSSGRRKEEVLAVMAKTVEDMRIAVQQQEEIDREKLAQALAALTTLGVQDGIGVEQLSGVRP